MGNKRQKEPKRWKGRMGSWIYSQWCKSPCWQEGKDCNDLVKRMRRYDKNTYYPRTLFLGEIK